MVFFFFFRPAIQSIYQLESDFPVILTAHAVLQHLEDSLFKWEPKKSEDMKAAVSEAVQIMKELDDGINLTAETAKVLHATKLTEITNLRSDIEAAVELEKVAIRKLQRLAREREELQTSRVEKRRKMTEKAYANASPNLQKKEQEHEQLEVLAQSEVDAATKAVKLSKDEAGPLETNLATLQDDWDKKSRAALQFSIDNLVTEDDFWGAAVEVSKPSKNYYSNLFVDGTDNGLDDDAEKHRNKGELMVVRKIIEGCSIFDPELARGMSKVEAARLIDLLKPLPGLDDACLAALKSSFEAYQYCASQNYDWNADAESVAYNRMAAEKTKIKWQSNPGEKARRILGWWQNFAPNRLTPPDWKRALVPVILYRINSADCERVFSCVKQVIDTIGYAARAETMNVRLREVCHYRHRTKFFINNE
jgi:hypothetical protein